MSMSQALLPELDKEAAGTREVLARVPMELADWKPHEKSFSMGELANHMARLLGWGAVTLQTESFDMDPEVSGFAPPPPVDDPEGLLAAFDAGASDFRKALEEASDEDLSALWTLQNGGQDLFTLPRIGVLRGMILNHLVHHRGQMTVYLRMNDVPVPALYGPSADEES